MRLIGLLALALIAHAPPTTMLADAQEEQHAARPTTIAMSGAPPRLPDTISQVIVTEPEVVTATTAPTTSALPLDTLPEPPPWALLLSAVIVAGFIARSRLGGPNV